MAKLSLKVVVAGRTYPLSVDESEEQRVLNAANDINKAIKLLQDNYAVKDMQDLLAMTALQMASKSESNKPEGVSKAILEDIETDLKVIVDDLDKVD